MYFAVLEETRRNWVLEGSEVFGTRSRADGKRQARKISSTGKNAAEVIGGKGWKKDSAKYMCMMFPVVLLMMRV